jgi:RNA polymerase sigma factor (sigma-70 family)
MRGGEADEAAVTRCASGSAEALEELYAQHAGACLKHARSILVDAHHAEDAVQEAFLDLWRDAGRFDGSRSCVRSWLLMLTHRKAVDRVRAEQRRRTWALADGLEPVDERPGPEVQAVLLGRQTRTALATLSAPQRQAVVLAFWGGYTQREIAGLTQTPIGTIKSRMHFALKELGRTIDRDGSPRNASVVPG